MPARTFTRETIRWRVCPKCGNEFPDSRKDRVHCGDVCRWSARRVRKHEADIATAGGKCADCGTTYDPERKTTFCVTEEGVALCRPCSGRRSRSKRQKRGQV